MWDNQTESLWQQGTFEAIVGEFAGTRLKTLPSTIVAWEDFRKTYPEGEVLSRESNPTYEASGSYGFNPYSYYDSSSRPFLFEEEIDDRLPAMERVVGLTAGGKATAYPFTRLVEIPVVYATLGSREVAILYEGDTRSPLDDNVISLGRKVGTVGVFVPEVKGQRLTLVADGDFFKDQETGSTWNIFGQGVEGKLKGERMPPISHTQSFWFYWAAANPDTEIWEP